jgi:hypothetical protein
MLGALGLIDTRIACFPAVVRLPAQRRPGRSRAQTARVAERHACDIVGSVRRMWRNW